MNMPHSIATRAFVLVLLGLAPWALASEHPLHARVSFDAGGTLVRGAEDAEWSQATLNTMVLPGDTLWVDQGGTAEIEFSGGTFLRMADGSKVEIAGMPPSGLARGWHGAFQVQRMNRSSGDFVFSTPACMVEVERDTAVRLDVVEQGATTVSVRWGRAIVRTDTGGVVYVYTGQRVWVDTGMQPSNPLHFDRTLEDTFDVWNRERAKILAEGLTSAPAAVNFAPQTLGAAELAPYGEWVYVDNRHYWRPTVVVDYVPYRHGHWSYVPAAGHVWVERYPFAYVTSHYGRWRHHGSYGWIWSYDPVWAPAWAATIRCGDYFIWAPVDYYYRPIVVRNAAVFTVGGVVFDIGVSSYVHVGGFYRGPAYVYGLTPGIATYVYRNPREVNIWNININVNAPNRVRVPYNSSVDRVRNYNPSRAIRGPSALDETALPAQQRAQRLESSLGRDRFSHVATTGSRGQRTELNPRSRMAEVRNVRVDSATPDALSAMPKIRGADPQMGPGIERRSMAASDAAPRGDDGRGVRATSAATAERPTRSGASVDARPARGAAVPSQSDTPRSAPPSSPAVRGGAESRREMRTETPPRSAPAPSAPAVRSTPGASSTPAPRSEARPNTPAPRATAPSTMRDIETRPGIRTRTETYPPAPQQRSIQTSPRTVSPPAVSRPSAPSAPSRSAPSPSMRPSAPSAPSRSAPSISVPSPSMRPSAPSAPSRSAPSVSVPSPSMRPSAPSAPSRSAPSVSAPSPSMRPSAPSAPSRRAPSISVPSMRGNASGGAVRGR